MENIENSTLTADNTTEEHAHELENEVAVLKHENEELKAKVKFLEEQFKLSQAQKYGSPSDTVDPMQLSIFNEAEKLSVQKNEEPDLEEITYQRKKGRSKSRKTYDDLEIVEVYYELPKEEQVCPKCDHELHEMKVEVRKELTIIPAQVKVTHHKRQVYACRHCDQQGTGGTIIKADAPNPVIAGSLTSPSLLAFIMDKKYVQAQPLYRQEKAFENFGIDISRQNMANWIVKSSEDWLKRLYDRMHMHLINEPIIHADETEMNVLDEKNNKKNYMWLYSSAIHGNHQIKLYEYQPSRAGRHPKNFLNGYAGFLQTDGYQAYNKIPDIIHVGCLAHGRRKFTDAIKAAPEDADIAKTKAYEAVKYFKKISNLEKEFKELSNEERYEKRLEKTKPLLEEFKNWLDVESKRTLPKSKLGQAISYNLKQWDKMIRFLEDGRVSVDNNHAERAIRPFVVGRKNWLFAKSPKGATASAICYSIIETAKANNLKPFQYLTYLFEKLPNSDVTDEEILDQLMPWSDSIPENLRSKFQDE
jgi:transposase